MKRPLRHLALVLTLCAVGALSGCSKPKDRGASQGVGGVGRPLVTGAALDLRVTPDGQFATYLAQAEKPRLEGIPPQMVLGELNVAPTAGGASRKLGNGVTNVPGGYLFSPDSRWVLFLAGYNAANQSGELSAADLKAPEAEKVRLGGEVSYTLTSPDSKQVAFVDRAVLKVGPLPGGPFKEVAGEVSTAQFSPDSKTLYFKRRLTAAGGLYFVTLGKDDAPRKLADQVGDFAISPDSQNVAFAQRSDVVRSTYDLLFARMPDMKPTRLALGTGGFAFSGDGKWLARTEGSRPELLGDLFVGPAGGGPGEKVGVRVQDFSFSPDSAAIAYLELYDISARAGLLGVASAPVWKGKRVGERCPNYSWGADGRFVAFLSRFLKPLYSVDLMLYPLGDEAAFKVNTGVFGYGFGPKNAYLLFRTSCIRDGRACDLYKVDLAKPKDAPKKIIEGIFSFKTSEQGDRVLVSYARTKGEYYDTAVFNMKTSERKTLEQFIRLPAMFLDEQGSKVAYIVGEHERAGVYVADQVP
ncbi:MAG: gliding motility protein [Myxococcaceae bacterium]